MTSFSMNGSIIRIFLPQLAKQTKLLKSFKANESVTECNKYYKILGSHFFNTPCSQTLVTWQPLDVPNLGQCLSGFLGSDRQEYLPVPSTTA